jgi:hypothetical protein
MSRAQDFPDDAALRRRQSTRQVRHAARRWLQSTGNDEEALDEEVLPTGHHDLGRKASPKPPTPAQPGRRTGFKVWKTTFWKRRTRLWAQRNAATRQVTETEQ